MTETRQSAPPRLRGNALVLNSRSCSVLPGDEQPARKSSAGSGRRLSGGNFLRLLQTTSEVGAARGRGGGQEQGPELVQGLKKLFCRGPEDPRGRPAAEDLPAFIPSRVTPRRSCRSPVAAIQPRWSVRIRTGSVTGNRKKPTVQQARLRQERTIGKR